MARRQDNGTTILLGLKDYRVVEVVEREEKVVVKTEVKGRIKCPPCRSGKLYGHGMCKPREILHPWSNGRRVYLEFHRRRWKCRDCKRTFAEGRELVRSRSRLTRQAEAEALWQLKDRNFSQVRRELGVGYSTLRRLLEREIDEEALGFIQNEDEIYLGIDEHSFRHQEPVHTVTEVKQRKVVGILRDDRIATLKEFLGKISRDKVKEVGIDLKEGLKKAAEVVFPLAKVVVAPFHVIADSIFNLKSADDAELIRWGNTLKHWREPILNHFDNHTTNGFTKGGDTR